MPTNWVLDLGPGCACGECGRSAPVARPSIPPAVRREVIARDGLTCRLCGVLTVRRKRGECGTDTLHLDHIVPYSLGGDDSATNLRVTCARCNCSRGNRVTTPPTADPTQADVGTEGER